jgi:hypothetical protein
MLIPVVIYPGESGREYEYWIYPLDNEFADEPGNFAFALEWKPGHWESLYFGQGDSLRDCCTRESDIKSAAIAKGATHILARINRGDERERLAEVGDLVARWNPACSS